MRFYCIEGYAVVSDLTVYKQAGGLHSQYQVFIKLYLGM